jgi:O-acetylhomoserine (thiol)-lyase
MADKPELLQPQTLALHGGFRWDPITNSTAPPIYQTTSYQFNDAQHAADLFGLSKPGNIYTRIMNPTNDILEKRITLIEGGLAALAVSSGQAASAFSIIALCSAGDNFVCSTDIYGGTWNLFNNTFAQLVIETRFADPEEFPRKTDAKTRAYYSKTLSNSKLHVFPIRAISQIGNEVGVPLIIDNTAAPIICKPFEVGRTSSSTVRRTRNIDRRADC